MKKFLNTRIRDMKAITLIALVITIVVLIILAAVAINLSFGNNGIFNRAKTAKEQYQNAESLEQLEVTKSTNQIDSYIDSNRSNEDNSQKLIGQQDFSIPWHSGSQNYSYTYDFSTIEGKENLTADNFLVTFSTIATYSYSNKNVAAWVIIEKAYNQETGILTVYYNGQQSNTGFETVGTIYCFK